MQINLLSSNPDPYKSGRQNRFGQEEPLAQVKEIWNGITGDIWRKALDTDNSKHKTDFTTPALRQFLKTCGITFENKNVLDMGCGEGFDARYIQSQGAKKVIGLDISEKMIEAARAKEAGSTIDYVVASFTNMPIPDSSQDIVISVMALMDSPDIQKALQEAYRVLAPGGEIVFVMKHPFTNREGRTETNQYIQQNHSYFDENPFLRTTVYSDQHTLSATVFPRTLSTLLNSVIDAGFTIAKIHEPKPAKETVDTLPQLSVWRNEPHMLMIYAKKAIS